MAASDLSWTSLVPGIDGGEGRFSVVVQMISGAEGRGLASASMEWAPSL